MISDFRTACLSLDSAQEIGGATSPAKRLEGASAVLASQSFLDATLSSIPDFVYAFDPQRRFAYANPATLAFFGLPAEEMLGKTFADLDYPADLAVPRPSVASKFC